MKLPRTALLSLALITALAPLAGIPDAAAQALAEPAAVAPLPVPTPAPAPPTADSARDTVTASGNSHLENAAIKVFSTLRAPDPFKPWSKASPQEVTGSGVVIEGKRILTNAHVVGYASQVQVQANQSGDKVPATVVAIARGMDLALLKLDDESFFDTHPPVKRSNALPDVRDAVFAYGYPTGGASLSITKGIVSRIEFVNYHGPVAGLRIQIDAAINPGNSGGPVAAGDRMIGLAFATATNAQNVGYIIPNEEIELFLKDVADGHYDAGKPGPARILETAEGRRGLGGAVALPPRAGLSAQGMGRHHPHRQLPDRQPGHGQAGREPRALPVPRAAAGQGRQGAADGAARR
jgi:S1-C subfamily serine protease